MSTNNTPTRMYRLTCKVADRRKIVVTVEHDWEIEGARRECADRFAKRIWGRGYEGYVDFTFLEHWGCRVRRASYCKTGGLDLYGDTFMMDCEVERIYK